MYNDINPKLFMHLRIFLLKIKENIVRQRDKNIKLN